ncbi:hypothetical protein TTRE_0000529101 [Trichuris trichiura]|uniref:Uncharacterized protein n=1 Tax=Trichuris trichiura TaxID=36087 RepID=A0A077ZBV3_TRITR|nr:hypothetical protein TTRE_0000529101 [Trichuris trichiura]
MTFEPDGKEVGDRNDVRVDIMRYVYKRKITVDGYYARLSNVTFARLNLRDISYEVEFTLEASNCRANRSVRLEPDGKDVRVDIMRYIYSQNITVDGYYARLSNVTSARLNLKDIAYDVEFTLEASNCPTNRSEDEYPHTQGANSEPYVA